MRDIEGELKEVEHKMNILKNNNLEDTTKYIVLQNSRRILRDMLANIILKELSK